jgi:hypothetical protein
LVSCVTKLAIPGAIPARVEFVERKYSRIGLATSRAAPWLNGISQGVQPMRDFVIGVAFIAMLLTPAIVASFSKNKTDDEV